MDPLLESFMLQSQQEGQSNKADGGGNSSQGMRQHEQHKVNSSIISFIADERDS